MDDVALLFRLIGALLFVAGIVLTGVAFEFAHRRDRPAEIALLLGLARISVVLVAVGGLLLPVFGLWLVHLGNFGYGSGWVDAAIALYVVVLVLGGLGDRRPKEARLLAMRLAAEDGPTTNEPHARSMIECRASAEQHPALEALDCQRLVRQPGFNLAVDHYCWDRVRLSRAGPISDARGQRPVSSSF